MGDRRRRDVGFTLVELMTVVLIIGILVTIAAPVYADASHSAQAKSCQANQRTIVGCVEMYRSLGGSATAGTEGLLAAGGSGWYAALVPGWIKNRPTCPQGPSDYFMGAAGDVRGDQGVLEAFRPNHELPR